jgi:hypothetical protein
MPPTPTQAWLSFEFRVMALGRDGVSAQEMKHGALAATKAAFRRNWRRDQCREPALPTLFVFGLRSTVLPEFTREGCEARAEFASLGCGWSGLRCFALALAFAPPVRFPPAAAPHLALALAPALSAY